MTPCQLEVLLHHYYSPEPLLRDSRAYLEAQSMLVGQGLIEPSGEPGCYQATPRGRVYVEALQAVPLPKMASYWEVECLNVRGAA